MKTKIKLLLTLTVMATLNATAQADTLYGSLRDGTATRKIVGLIPHNLPPGTTDAIRYIHRPQVGLLYEVSHRAPPGTTDRARQLSGERVITHHQVSKISAHHIKKYTKDSIGLKTSDAPPEDC